MDSFKFKEKDDSGGIIISGKSFGNKDESDPTEIEIKFGYDRPLNLIFFYFHRKDKEEELNLLSEQDVYDSLHDGGSLLSFNDPPLKRLNRFLQILIKFQIYIPIKIFEILFDTSVCGPNGNFYVEWECYYRDYFKYKVNVIRYYQEFSKLLSKQQYNQLTDKDFSATIITNPKQ